MKIAILVPDNRENFREYDKETPYFGTAPEGLLTGFRSLDAQINSGEMLVSRGNLECFEIHVLSCTQRPMKSPAKLANSIWFHSLHVPKRGWLKTGYLGCVLAIRRKLREIQPDLVHAQGTERDCAISAVFSGFPKILTIHGNLRLISKTVGFRPFSALWLQTLLKGFVVPRFDGVICITSYTKDAVKDETKKTWVIPNAVDPDFLALGDRRETENAELNAATPQAISGTRLQPVFTILVVANVDERKNQNAFIQALDAMAKTVPFRVKFFGRCGEDEYGKQFHRLVTDRPWCSYGGMVGREQLRAEFAQASAVALPTHEDNCPMVVLEAQAAGVPVMASNVGGVPDLVEDEVTGLLTNPNDSQSMCLALQRLMLDHALVAKLIKNGRAQALRKFHPRVIASEHLAVYSEVLASRS